MTEQEYIDATNLAKVRAARELIGNLDLKWLQGDWAAARQNLESLEKKIERAVMKHMKAVRPVAPAGVGKGKAHG